MSNLKKLSEKHRLFVEAYDGDLTYAARVAGYIGNDSYLHARGRELLADPMIIEAIKHRSRYLANIKSTIATREERQQLWSDIMRNEDPYLKEETDSNNVPIRLSPNIPLPTRLKASELLGKSEADFVDKVDMTTQVTITDVIKQSYEEDKSVEAIEAEYWLSKNKKAIAQEDDEQDTLNLDPLI